MTTYKEIINMTHTDYIDQLRAAVATAVSGIKRDEYLETLAEKCHQLYMEFHNTQTHKARNRKQCCYWDEELYYCLQQGCARPICDKCKNYYQR